MSHLVRWYREHANLDMSKSLIVTISNLPDAYRGLDATNGNWSDFQ